MTMKHVLGTMLASRMAGRGGRRGGGGAGFGTAAILGLLAGRRGLGGRAGLAGLAFMAYQAYQGQQARNTDPAGHDRAHDQTAGRTAGSGGGIADKLGELADRFLGTGTQDPAGGRPTSPPEAAAAPRPAPAAGSATANVTPPPEAEAAARHFSDEKALLLVCAMIAATHADGRMSEEERARILKHLDDSGADEDDRRIVAHEMKHPRSLDDLLREVEDPDTAQEFYLASRAAIDGESEAQKAYLRTLRHRLALTEEDAEKLEELVS